MMLFLQGRREHLCFALTLLYINKPAQRSYCPRSSSSTPCAQLPLLLCTLINLLLLLRACLGKFFCQLVARKNLQHSHLYPSAFHQMGFLEGPKKLRKAACVSPEFTVEAWPLGLWEVIRSGGWDFRDWNYRP
jgi:hypothetical protein